MTKNLMRRLERLERVQRIGPPAWHTKLRLCARWLRVDEEELLGMVKGHERQLDHALADDGGITWEGFLLLYGLREQARHGSPEPVTGGALLGGDPR